eukprot:TRINITY_DN1654_c3_g2_i6.p1 TRINITY_DN1654_c3_g2~~TRINITY_DN1654_c3_g2_i6.p1  ORF type:complete len:616 (+),score=121.33 TRINITY_DN1654_c3_g2_i6:72-1919(+)
MAAESDAAAAEAVKAHCDSLEAAVAEIECVKGPDSPLPSLNKATEEEEEGIPLGSFGCGGWAAAPKGATGKYPVLTLSECEDARVNFRKLLLLKYSTVLRGWKEMDTNGDGRLSLFEFMRGCQGLGVMQGARQIWSALDIDRSGSVSLDEIDPVLAETLAKLAVCVWGIYGSVNQAWKGCFNERGVMRISREEFVRACKGLRFEGDALLAYNELCTDKAGNGMSRAEFGWLHIWISGGAPDRIHDEVSKWDTSGHIPWKPPPVQAETGVLRKQFKELLLKSYSNFVRAWREGLDRDHNGALDYKEFTVACKDVGFHGNPRKTWAELDTDGNGTVSLWELDSNTAQLLKDFVECADKAFGSWEAAWDEAFDTRKDNRVKFQAFQDGCIRIGWKHSIERMFEYLDSDKTKYLTRETTLWIAGIETEVPEDVQPVAVGETLITGAYRKTTRAQQRRADVNARNHRIRKNRFLGRARGEIPGSNVLAGTTLYEPGQTFMLTRSQSAPSMDFRPSSSFSIMSDADRKAFRQPADIRELPDWFLIADGRKTAPAPKPKMDLTFPLFPQSPGKGGWPQRRMKMVDESWGGTRDIGHMLSPLARKACSPANLTRWREQASSGL